MSVTIIHSLIILVPAQLVTLLLDVHLSTIMTQLMVMEIVERAQMVMNVKVMPWLTK